MLMMLVLLMVGIDLLIHVIGTAIPESRLNATLIPDELTPKGIDVWDAVLQYHVYRGCN